MMKILLILAAISLASCSQMFLSKPVSEDFMVNKRYSLVKSNSLVRPKINGIYWFLTGDTLHSLSRQLRKLNYNFEYDSLGLKSGYFFFKENGELRYVNSMVSTYPENTIKEEIEGLKRDLSGYKGYYIVNDSVEMEYLRIEAQLIKKYYYEFRAKLSSNADTLLVYYEKSRDGKIYKSWNKIAVFYPFPDSVKMK